MTNISQEHIAVLNGLIETTLDRACRYREAVGEARIEVQLEAAPTGDELPAPVQGVVFRVHASVEAGHDPMRDLRPSLPAPPATGSAGESQPTRRSLVGP